jgi:peptidoglycan/LPS O-acetylase OafA/YrhL
MSTTEFFKRRLIRLHPMIVISMVIGMTLIPVGAALDIRGWGEMHPLNGPGWSLFYEYVGNILYALFVRKFSKLLLALFVFATGAVLLHWCLTSQYGDLIGGWSVAPDQVRIGLTRLLYPFFAGLLLLRVVKVGHVKHAFLLSSVLIIVALAMPRLGGEQDV